MTPDEVNREAAVLRPDVLSGSVALVTGAGTGIGRATARELARCGARVVLAGRREEPLRQTAALIAAAGGESLMVPTDIREQEEVGELVTAALERFGRIDVLVNNAGGQFAAPAEQISPKGWRAVHRLTVDGTWAVTREVAERAMIPRRGGVVVFLAFSPRRGIPGMVHATSARAALENLASGLALEWSRYGIRSVCLAVGTVDTGGLAENYTPAERRRWAAGIPLHRFGRPEEVASLIAYLASPAGSYITGTTLTIDGGADAWGAGGPAPEPEQP